MWTLGRTILPDGGRAAEDEDGLPGVRSASAFGPERLQAEAFLLAPLVVEREHDAYKAGGDCGCCVEAHVVWDLPGIGQTSKSP